MIDFVWLVQGLSYFSWVTWIWPDNAGESAPPFVVDKLDGPKLALKPLHSCLGMSSPIMCYWLTRQTATSYVHGMVSAITSDSSRGVYKLMGQGMSVLTFDWGQIAYVFLLLLARSRGD